MPKAYQKAERDFKKPMSRETLWDLMQYIGHDTSTPEAKLFVDRNEDLIMPGAWAVSAIATGLEQIKQELEKATDDTSTSDNQK